VDLTFNVNKKLAGVGVAVGALALIAVGFFGFYTVIVPQLVNLSAFSLVAVVGFGVLAGVLSFFAPCSLAIFPSYMGYFLSEADQTGRRGAVKYGSVASAGMVLFYALLGVTVSYIGGLSSVQSILRIGIPVMAVVLGAVGLYFVSGRTLQGRLFADLGSRFIKQGDTTHRNLFLFGFGYSMSSIACVFPVFLLLVAYPFITGNVMLGLMAFLAFAGGKSVLMVAATVLTAESRSQLLTSQSKKFGYIKKGSGVLLVVVALYLTYYTLAMYGVIAPI